MHTFPVGPEMSRPVLMRCHACFFLEYLNEVALGAERQIIGNINYGVIRVLQ